jgi:DNA-binding MarR family transcriptional regulator
MLILDNFLPYRLSIVTNRVSETIARAYRDAFGLSIPEWRVLAVAAESDGLTQQQVGQRTEMDKVTVSRAAIALTRRGLVARTHGPNDKRARTLALTEEGRVLYAQVAPRALALEAKIFENFHAGELAELNNMLDRIAQGTRQIDAAD